MAQSFNNNLLNQGSIAYRAKRALSQTRLGAGSCNGFNGLLRMAQSSNNLLRNNHRAADRAMVALGQAGFSAGGSNGCIGGSGVAQCLNLFLRNDDFAANGAVRALGQASLGTGGGNGLVDHFGVSVLANNNLVVRAGQLRTGDKIIVHVVNVSNFSIYEVDALAANYLEGKGTGSLGQGSGSISGTIEPAIGACIASGGLGAVVFQSFRNIQINVKAIDTHRAGENKGHINLGRSSGKRRGEGRQQQNEREYKSQYFSHSFFLSSKTL